MSGPEQSGERMCALEMAATLQCGFVRSPRYSGRTSSNTGARAEAAPREDGARQARKRRLTGSERSIVRSHNNVRLPAMRRTP